MAEGQDRSRLLGTPFVSRAARWGIVAWAALGIGALLFFFYRGILYPVRVIFPPLVLALIFVYALNPIVTWLQGKGVGRIWGALITYVILLGALGVGLRFLIPVLVDQVEEFTRSLPALLRNAQNAVSDLLQRVGGEGAGQQVSFDSQAVTDVAGRLLNLTLGVLNGALVLVLGLILGFYLLVDIPKIQRGIVAMIPARRRPEVLAISEKLGRAIGGFFRGQLLVALFVGIASTLALYIVGLPYWALVGMITGLFNLIPLIGPFIGGGIAAFVAFTTNTAGEGLLHLEPGWPLAIGATVGLLIVQQIDNHIISPNVVARTVKLHPVTVMLALLAGGTLLGLWGMLLAVPTVASIKILVLHAWDTQMTWPPTAERAPPPEEP
ncbi:MAG TPA: AI-2E family transporter, partial [Actinomycetota bacterium]|nr:AI-2E family transporter [Actinomycetota bacterium]